MHTNDWREVRCYCGNNEGRTDRPNPATQCTATQQPGCVANLSRSRAKKRSTTSGGGAVPSSNGRSCIRAHTKYNMGKHKHAQTDRHTV